MHRAVSYPEKAFGHFGMRDVQPQLPQLGHVHVGQQYFAVYQNPVAVEDDHRYRSRLSTM